MAKRRNNQAPEDNRTQEQKDRFIQRGEEMSISQCILCRHAHKGKTTCDAFPEAGIPLDILKNDFDHSNEHIGDHGIRFEPR